MIVARNVRVQIQIIAWHTFVLACIVAFAFVVHVWGIYQDLPIAPEVDESTKVLAAMNMISTGDMNPHWFGHPGSTIIYPLALLQHIWYVTTYHGKLFQVNPEVRAVFDATPSTFYLLGRMLSIAYAVATVPCVYLLGKRVFNTPVALLGTWFACLVPIALVNAQLARTDSAATFFGILGLWLCLRVYDQPTTRNQMLAGVVIGLAAASRYFMAALVPVLFAVDVLLIWQSSSRRSTWRALRSSMIVGMLAVPIIFAVTTPFFFLAPHEAWQSLKHEARGDNLGADGLSRLGNLWWYLSNGLPMSVTWPRYIFLLAGVILVAWRRRIDQLLLLLYTVVLLGEFCLSALHWQRWLIPILPVLALFTAAALFAGVERIAKQFALRQSFQRALLVLVLVLVSAWPFSQEVQESLRNGQPSTRVLAREWIMQNLPPNTHLAVEWYSVSLTVDDFYGQVGSRPAGYLSGSQYALYESKSLSQQPLAAYQTQHFQYLAVSSEMYDRYLAEAQRYPEQVAWYKNLFASQPLAQTFEPSATRGGPTIRIYKVVGAP